MNKYLLAALVLILYIIWLNLATTANAESFTFPGPRSGYGVQTYTYDSGPNTAHWGYGRHRGHRFKPWIFRRGPITYFDKGDGNERYYSKHGKGYARRTIEVEKIPKALRGYTPPNITGYDDTHVIITEDDYGKLLRKGLKYYTIYKLQKAIPYFSKAIEIDPSRLDAIEYRALCFYKLEMFEYAIEDYHAALQRWPSVRIMHSLASAYLQIGYDKEGTAWMKKAAAGGNPLSQKWLVAKGIINE